MTEEERALLHLLAGVVAGMARKEELVRRDVAPNFTTTTGGQETAELLTQLARSALSSG
jgi:hypothetical protein